MTTPAPALPLSASSARIAGLIYLLIIGLGLFGESYVRATLVVAGDATQTAVNILTSESLWRAGIAGDLLMHVLDVPLIVFFYLLLKPVNPRLALLATLLNIVQTSVLAINKLTLVAPLLLLSSARPEDALATAQLQELAYLAIQSHGYGFAIGLVFFGVASVLRGVLILRSDLLPSTLGLLLVLAGLSYLVNSAALLLAPELASLLFPAVLIPAFVGELALALWLLGKGVNHQAWRQRVLAAA